MKFFIGFLFFFSSLGASAQWVRQTADTLKVRVGLVVPRYNFELSSPNEDVRADFEPNSATKTALSFSYRNLGFNVYLQNPTSAEDNKNFGHTNTTDLQFRVFGKRTYELYYQNYEGYFIRNSEALDPSYAGVSNKIQRPDIRTQNIGMNFYWNLNEEDFSQAMAFDQAGFQTADNWGLSWLLHGNHSLISGDTPFIPAAAASQFGKLAALRKLQRDTLAGGMAIGGIAVYGRYYLAGLLGGGLGYQRNELEYQSSSSENNEALGVYATARGGFGYNSEKYVMGLQVFMDEVTTSLPMGHLYGKNIELTVFYSYRFSDINIPVANAISSWLD